MKTLIFLLPIVICFDNYYIVNKKDSLVCGNKSSKVNNVNWYEAENGVFKNMSIALRRISAEACPTYYYCQYEDYITENVFFQTADLFIVNCPASTTLKEENFHQFHETTQKIIDKISNNNFYLLIFLLIIFSFYYIIKKFDLKKLIVNKPL